MSVLCGPGTTDSVSYWKFQKSALVGEVGSQYLEARPPLNHPPEVWLLEKSMKLETQIKDKAKIRFMSPTAVAFKLFQV